MKYGPTQEVLLARARRGYLMVAGNRERCAARRLVLRGTLIRYRLGGPGLGYTEVYRVVES